MGHVVTERKGQLPMDLETDYATKGKKAEMDREAGSLHLQEIVFQHRLWNHEAEKHTHHLCYLAENRQMADLAALVGNARFICHQCGRVAANSDNLCDPVDREWLTHA